MQLGETDLAIQYYQRSLKINPTDFATHNNLAVAFLAKNHVGFALNHFKEALKLQPENEAIEYAIHMLSQDQQLLSSPAAYIKNLFDAYADHYEQHLLQGLDYTVPEQLLHAVKTIIKNKTARLDIVDLGCGTGLCGVPFKQFANTLIGVDLSENMLEIAREKGIYDSLVAEDLQTWLSTQQETCDLIIAGDALVYIGDLSSIFRNTAKALRAKGLIAFNTEITKQNDFVMNQSGRFSHQKKYLEKLAAENHLNMVYYQEAITRQQNNAPVHGHIIVLQKS
jgi:predicted TPR repeat methyltransferase